MTEAQVAELAGVTLVRRCPEGEIGAFEVRLADGRPAVLKWYEDAAVRPRLDWMLSAVAALRDAGYPVPRYEPVVEVPGALVVLQEWMPGAVSDEVPPELVTRVIELNALQAGLTDSLNADARYARASVQSSAQEGTWPAMLVDGLTTPRPASPYVPEAAQIAAALSSSGITVPTDDAMHIDLHHRNVLQVDGRLSAVVDWETCRPGDRWYDLVVFALCLEVATAPASAEPVWRLIDAHVAPELVRAYTAYLALRLIDWSLDPNAPYSPDFWAAAARRRLR